MDCIGIFLSLFIYKIVEVNLKNKLLIQVTIIYVEVRFDTTITINSNHCIKTSLICYAGENI